MSTALPLHVGFIGSNTILNDGQTNNCLMTLLKGITGAGTPTRCLS